MNVRAKSSAARIAVIVGGVLALLMLVALVGMFALVMFA